MPSFSSRAVRTTEAEEEPLMEAEGASAAGPRFQGKFIVLGLTCVAALVSCAALLSRASPAAQSQVEEPIVASMARAEDPQVGGALSVGDISLSETRQLVRAEHPQADAQSTDLTRTVVHIGQTQAHPEVEEPIAATVAIDEHPQAPPLVSPPWSDPSLSETRHVEEPIVTTVVHAEHQQAHHEPDKQSTAPEQNCSGAGAGCLETKCCMDPGYACFTKNKWWAQCMPECIPGPNPLDQASPSPWECKALSDKVPGKPHECAASYSENCMQQQCCKDVGMQCFVKNDGWAACKPQCTPGPDLMAQDSDPWTCQELGAKKAGAAPWVKTKCTAKGEDCSSTKCCQDGGLQCYKHNAFWGECMESCEAGAIPTLDPWDVTPRTPLSCEELGVRNPGFADEVESVTKGIIASWVPEKCTGTYDNCANSQCCYGVDYQCYTKNQYYGTCRTECSTAPDPNDGNSTWDCTPLGPRAWGLSVKGYPSVFCISLYMPSSYEGPLLKTHLDMNAGIFTCDGYDVFAAEEDTLGKSKDGVVVKAIQIAKINVGVSQDGTAGNAKLFMAVWDKVIAGGRFRYYDWTVKVDPDAVLLAWRLREHMKPHTGEKVYVVNCNKFPSSPNFPMMYGALEIFSHAAMDEYALNSWRCGQELDWKAWGEDYFMTHCMDYIGVGRIGDFGVLGDNVCTGANCADGWTAAYHPFKTIGTWQECWGSATTDASA